MVYCDFGILYLFLTVAYCICLLEILLKIIFLVFQRLNIVGHESADRREDTGKTGNIYLFRFACKLITIVKMLHFFKTALLFNCIKTLNI